MYLNLLTKEEQHSFINLVSSLIMADRVVASKELELFNSYLSEIGEVIPFNERADFEAELEKMKTMSAFKKKKVYFELLSVAKGDSDYADEEKKMMEKVRIAFDITKEQAKTIEGLLDELTALYTKLGEALS